MLDAKRPFVRINISRTRRLVIVDQHRVGASAMVAASFAQPWQSHLWRPTTPLFNASVSP
jgi:hypothetical protein